MIPINDLARHYTSVARKIEQSVKRVLNSGWFILGPEVKAFEQEFSEYCGSSFCIGVGSGTDALEIALRALDIVAGDPVACVANAGFYGSTAISCIGAVPQYVDISCDNMTMNPDALEKTIKKNTRAIIVTHLYGQMADMPKILKIAEQNNIPLIEDCAQAHGASFNDRKAGNWGTLGCFSFYPTKNLGALGDAGAITTSNEQLADRVRLLRQYGWVKKYELGISGGKNSRLDEIQSAVLRTKLKYLDLWNQRRRDIAASLTEGLRDLDLILPSNFNKDYVAHLYVIRSERREWIMRKLNQMGIGTDIHYPIPDHRQETFHGAFAGLSLPNTERSSLKILTLPCFPEMLNHEIEQVIDSIHKVFY